MTHHAKQTLWPNLEIDWKLDQAGWTRKDLSSERAVVSSIGQTTDVDPYNLGRLFAP